MKKWLSLIMALAMLVCMTACGAKPDDTENGTTTTQNNKIVSIQPHLETAYAPYELYYFDCGIVTVGTSDGFVMLDTEGKQIGEDNYHMLYSFGEDGRAKAQLDQDSDWVWIDTTGAVVGTAEVKQRLPLCIAPP